MSSLGGRCPNSTACGTPSYRHPTMQISARLLKQSATPDALNLRRLCCFHSNARNELRLLAEKLNAPVIVTRNAKGVLSEDHPLALQICYGYLGREALQPPTV